MLRRLIPAQWSFGATGDLTKRLVVPALYNLLRSKVLPEQFALIGVALGEGTSEGWRDQLHGMLTSFVDDAAEFDAEHLDEGVWRRLAEKMIYVQGDLSKPELYEKLRSALNQAEETLGTQGNAIFYLAVADRLFDTVVEHLGKAKLTDQDKDPERQASMLAPRGDREAIRPQPEFGA